MVIFHHGYQREIKTHNNHIEFDHAPTKKLMGLVNDLRIWNIAKIELKVNLKAHQHGSGRVAVGIGELIYLSVVQPFWLSDAGQSHPGSLLAV